MFGHVIDGLDTLDRMEKVPGDANDRWVWSHIAVVLSVGVSQVRCAALLLPDSLVVTLRGEVCGLRPGRPICHCFQVCRAFARR